jgi:hypothetical protein
MQANINLKLDKKEIEEDEPESKFFTVIPDTEVIIALTMDSTDLDMIKQLVEQSKFARIVMLQLFLAIFAMVTQSPTADTIGLATAEKFFTDTCTASYKAAKNTTEAPKSLLWCVLVFFFVHILELIFVAYLNIVDQTLGEFLTYKFNGVDLRKSINDLYSREDLNPQQRDDEIKALKDSLNCRVRSVVFVLFIVRLAVCVLIILQIDSFNNCQPFYASYLYTDAAITIISQLIDQLDQYVMNWKN